MTALRAPILGMALLAWAGPAPAVPPSAARPPASPEAPSPGAQCTGEYADFLSAMRRETRAFEASADAAYTYLLRASATYEHLYYGRDGQLRRSYVRHVRHGTAFAYQVRDGEWYVATNQHVSEHPAVTEGDNEVEGVPAGSRKVRETVRLVAAEDDDEAAAIPLTPVLADEALDLAVLKTSRPLHVMPYRLGRSEALRVGNAVHVRGYPLGAFAASNTGRVISVRQPDHERGWDHEDFAVDALLNTGNSGSPVFAVSCATGELELVGLYHAGYRDAQALNVVVAIDQLRGALLELKVAPRRPASGSPDRASLAARLQGGAPVVMPFGDRVVSVAAVGDEVRFDLLAADYPLTTGRQLALVHRGGELGRPAALLFPERLGDGEAAWASLEPALRDAGERLDEALWRQLAGVLAYRDDEARRRAGGERSKAEAAASGLRARRAEQREILASIDFEAEVGAAPDGALPAAREVHAGAQVR